MKHFLSILILLFLGPSAGAAVLKVPANAQYLEIIGIIDGRIIREVADPILQIINQNDPASKDIYILINSPGGAVLPGTSVLDAMRMAKSRGFNFKCISGVLAASMAFSILVECNERYALKDTKLLFHPVSVSGSRARLQEVLVSYDAILKVEKRMMKKLQQEMKLPWRKFHMHYFAETLWAGEELSLHTDKKFLKIVTDVTNIRKLFVFSRTRAPGYKGRSTEFKQAFKVLKRAGLQK